MTELKEISCLKKLQKYSQFIIKKCSRNVTWKQNKSKYRQSIIGKKHKSITESDKAKLFNIYMNGILVKWKHICTKDITLSTSTRINTLLFVDGQVMRANSEDNLERRIQFTKHSRSV